MVAGKIGKLVAKLILMEENLANLPILRLKIIQQNSSIILERITENM